MRETMLNLLEELAARCGRDLERPANRAQIASWLRDFGKQPDEILRDAFAELTGTVEKWPEYGQVREAIRRTAVRYRDAAEKSADVCTDVEPVVAIAPGAIAAAANYAMVASRRGDLDAAGVAGMVERILRGEITPPTTTEDLCAAMTAPASTRPDDCANPTGRG